MSKSYRGYAETEDWSSGRAFRRPSKRKSEQDWKKELEMTSKDSLFSVYVIINEWSPEDAQEDFSEIVEAKWYESESEAWDDLAIIAESMSVTLDREDTSFYVPERQVLGLSRDTYYIQELTR